MTTVVQYWDGEKWQHENPVQAQGKIEAPASVVEAASLNIPVGLAPVPPTIGDIWHTSDGLFYRNNAGVSVGPIGTIDESNLVHKTGTETITGDKTFAGMLTVASTGYVFLQPKVDSANYGLLDISNSSAKLAASSTSGGESSVVANGSGLQFTTGTGDITFSLGGAVYVYSDLDVSGLIIADSSDTGQASLRIPHGTAPTSPVNGDMWTTTGGIYFRINGSTLGPLVDSSHTHSYLSSSTSSTQSGYFGDIYLWDDAAPSHYLQITNSSNLTLARTLSINVDDASRSIALSGNLTVSASATISGTNTGDQTITLTGDVTGSGTGSFATTLATVNTNTGSWGTASSVATFTVNGKGLITAASNTAIQIAQSQVTNLTTDLAAKATDTLVVHLAGTETITGAKTFSLGSTQNSIRVGVTAAGEIDTSAGNLTIDSAGGTVTVDDNLIVSGDLTINGTTTTVNSTTVTVDDPIFTLGGDTAPTVDDNKDRGIEFRWHNGTVAKIGFFGYDDSTGSFTFIPDATNTSEVFSGTKGTIDAFFSGSNINAGTVSATYIDSAIARLASPTFTGTVTIPTLDLTTAATATAATSYWVETGSDGVVRPKTLANVKAELVVASEVLTKLLTVDGTGSSLDADTVDGTHLSDIVATRATTASTNSSDFNTFTTPGSYTVSGNGTWTGSTNGPTSAYAYGQLVVTTNGNIVTQVYYTHQTQQWIRSKFNAADWQAWHRLWGELNDGSGSGLDADLLDGIQESALIRADGTRPFSDYVQITSSAPRIVFTDTDTNADSRVTADSGAGSLMLQADINNEIAGSALRFSVDGTESMTLAANAALSLFSATGTYPQVRIYNTTDAVATGPNVYLEKLPTAAVVDGDDFGTIVFRGRTADGNAAAGAAILGEAAGTTTAGQTYIPGRLRFLTSPGGTTSSQYRMTIDENGNLFVGTTEKGSNQIQPIHPFLLAGV